MKRYTQKTLIQARSCILQYLGMEQQVQQYLIDEDGSEDSFDPLLFQKLLGLIDKMTQISIHSTEEIQQYWKKVAEDIRQNILKLNEQSENTLYKFNKWEYRIETPTVSPICSKSIADSPSKRAFRCFDCMSINTALLCYDCFSKSNHKGHSYRQFQTLGGCCDCGDSQLWNQNGFCPDHNSKSVVPNLSVSLVEKFKKQMLFLFYFYFLLVKKQNQFSEIRQFLGKRLFRYLINIANQNYESKVMVGQLLASSYQNYYKDGQLHGRLITLIFNLNHKYNELEDLKSISFSLYPVESFRAVLIRQYFDLTAKNQFVFQHPLKKFNFQYLICVKTIVKMIKQKQLLPIHLNPAIAMKDKDHTISIFKKYYEDISYMRKAKTKENQQYFQIHFSLMDFNHMFFYREMSNIEGGSYLDLDQFALKLTGVCLEYFKDNRPMLKKGMWQLFIEIENNQKLSYCLPHERAFALYLMVYLQGRLEILQDEIITDQITNIIGFNEQNKSGHKDIFIKIIKKGLLNIAYIQAQKSSNQRNDYQKYFFSMYPEKNFENSLDLIYHKSLYLLSHSIIDYATVVKEVFQELRKKENCQSKIAALLVFISKMMSDTFNEPCIANFLGYRNIEYTTIFNLRLIATYSNKMSIKDLKSLSNYFISNPQLFDKILHDYVRMQKGKIKLTQEVIPLQRLLYSDLFIYFKHYNQINCSKTHHLQSIPYMSQLHIFTPQIVYLLIQNCLTTYKHYQIEDDETKKQLCLHTLQVQITGLLRIYLLTKDKEIIQFLDENGYEISKAFKSDNFRQEIGCLLVEKHNAEKSKEESIDQEEESKRKEKIALKRKEKESLLKKKQQAALKLFSPVVQKAENAEQCVYCKQNLEKQYQLLGLINLTNFVAKSMKSSQMHFFLTTCGHKMHQHCYNKYFQQKKTIDACFLCKKKTNFAITKRQLTPQNAQSSAISFFDSLYISISTVFGNDDTLFDNFYLEQCNGNILQAVIISLCKQLIYFGLHKFDNFKKYSLPGYLVIYEMLAHSNKQWLKEAFHNIQQKQLQSQNEQNQLYQLQMLGYKILKSKFLAEHPNLDQANYDIYGSKLHILIEMLENKSTNEIEIEPIDLITMDKIFIKIPKNIHDLHEMMGECPFCKKITNWLYYCMICGWKCCNKQFDHFSKHSLDHLQGSVFISAGNGKTSIIFMKKVSNQESIYENQFGQEYTHIEENLKKQTLLSFHLNETKLHNLFLILLTHSIQNN